MATKPHKTWGGHAFVPFEHVCVDVTYLRPYVLDTRNTWCCVHTHVYACLQEVLQVLLQKYLVLHEAILDETVRP